MSPNLTRPWWLALPQAVCHDSHPARIEDGDLLVGVGDPQQPGRPSGAVVLNHKAVSGRAGQPRATSLSRLVWTAGPDWLGEWRRALPQGIVGVRRIVVEDASPDTCLALLIFARRVSPDPVSQAQALGAVQQHGGDPSSPRLDAWLAYVDAWERGLNPDGPDPRRSAACLMSALAHSLLAEGMRPGQPGIEPTAVADALRACLSLLDAYIACNAVPTDATPPTGLPAHALADSLLEFEQQNYLLALKHGIQTQLAVPLAGSGRRLLVDALIVTDVDLGGILKELARRDTGHSWTQRGFAVLGLYRPSLRGTGGDMTLSVDPRTGLTLQALWEHLETMEDDRWAGKRPCSQPRRGILGYTDPATGETRAGAPDQPWYDGGPGHTLVAAPRSVGSPPQPGSRLGWDADVLPALWSLYRPFPEGLAAETLRRVAGRRIATVRWPRDQAAAAGRTRALHGWLASCSAATPARHPGEFVPAALIEVVPLPGGDLLTHPGGVTLFDDWTAVPLDTASLLPLLVALAELTDGYQQLLQGDAMRALLSDEAQALQAPHRAGFKRLAALRDRALALKSRLATLATQELALPSPHGAAEVQSAVERAWGLPEARHRIADTVTQVDDLLTQAQALLQDRRQFLSTAIVSMAGLFFVVRDGLAVVADYLTLNRYEMLLPIARQLQIDPAALAELSRNATVAGQFDLATLVAMGVVFLVGGVLMAHRYFGAQDTGSALPTATSSPLPVDTTTRR